MHIRQSRLSVILGFAISLATPAISFAIELQVTPEAVTIEEVTPGGEVAIVWAARQYGVVAQTSWDTFIATDDDHDGEIVLSDLDRTAVGGPCGSSPTSTQVLPPPIASASRTSRPSTSPTALRLSAELLSLPRPSLPPGAEYPFCWFVRASEPGTPRFMMVPRTISTEPRTTL